VSRLAPARTELVKEISSMSDTPAEPTHELPVPILKEIDHICVRFETAWQEGRRPNIETFLEAIQEPARSQLFCELLRLELEYRHRLGETPREEDYCERFPEHEPQIAAIMRDLAADAGRPNSRPMVNVPTEAEALALASGLEIGEKLEAGGMGTVYKAYQKTLERTVAVKTVRPELLTPEGLVRFQREAVLLAKINHPSIVRVLDFHATANVPFMIMEFVDGIPLDTALRNSPYHRRASVLKEVVSAVASAHEQNVVHGDLKPANVLVDRQFKPHVLDFGLARLSRGDSARWHEAEHLGGTLAYMAPEVLDCKTGPTCLSDIYALGVTLYVMLTGVLPFKNIAEIRYGQPKLPLEHDPDVPEALQRICLKAMERLPEDRYQTVEQLLLDLSRYLEGWAIYVRPTLYARELDGRMHNHVADVQIWNREGLVSVREMDRLLKPYYKILGFDSPWFSTGRKFLGSPLMIRVGAWLLLISAVLWPVFYWSLLGTAARLSSSGVPCLLMIALGFFFIRTRNRKNAMACLGSFTMLLLVFVVVLLSEYRLLRFQQPPDWELWGEQLNENSPEGGSQGGTPFLNELILSNSQIFSASLLITLCIAILLRYFKSVFFASWLCFSLVALFASALLLIGDMRRINTEQISSVAVHWLWVSAFIFLIGLAFDLRGFSRMAGPFYQSSAVILLLASVSLARFGTEEWLKRRWDWSSEAWNVWLMAYSIPWFLIAWASEKKGTESLRSVTWLFYWLVPSFLLIPLNVLFADKGLIFLTFGGYQVHRYELLYLTACAILFVLGKQLHIEVFLLASLVGLAVFIFRVTSLHFEEYRIWPMAVALVGALFVLLGAWRSYKTRAEDRDRVSQPTKTEEITRTHDQKGQPPTETFDQQEKVSRPFDWAKLP
jgi:hypothetical protein